MVASIGKRDSAAASAPFAQITRMTWAFEVRALAELAEHGRVLPDFAERTITEVASNNGKKNAGRDLTLWPNAALTDSCLATYEAWLTSRLRIQQDHLSQVR